MYIRVNILSVRLAAIMASLLVLPPICGIMRSPDPSFGMESIRIRSAAYRQCTALVTMAFLFFFWLYTIFYFSVPPLCSARNLPPSWRKKSASWQLDQVVESIFRVHQQSKISHSIRFLFYCCDYDGTPLGTANIYCRYELWKRQSTDCGNQSHR